MEELQSSVRGWSIIISVELMTMDDHHWIIAKVILSLLTFVLAVSTLIVIACIKRENKRFFKRFALKTTTTTTTSALEKDEQIDLELQNLMLKLSDSIDLQNEKNIR